MQLDAYMPLVQRIAARIHSRAGSGDFDLADLVQLGMVGLLEAAHRYMLTRGVPFESYAEYRINGAILNGLASYSELQRQLAVQRELAHKPVESPHEGMADPEVGFATDDGPVAPDNAYARVELTQLRQRVAKLTAFLPESERRVIVRHYFQQLSLDEVARSLGLTNGRVSHLHHAALRRLREHLHGLGTADML